SVVFRQGSTGVVTARSSARSVERRAAEVPRTARAGGLTPAGTGSVAVGAAVLAKRRAADVPRPAGPCGTEMRSASFESELGAACSGAPREGAGSAPSTSPTDRGSTEDEIQLGDRTLGDAAGASTT